MAHFNFERDLRDSEASVYRLAHFLKEKYEIETFDLEHTSAWDLRFCYEGDFCPTIELKHDLKAPETGNVAIEYMSRGKDSGIRTSRADWWCYLIGEDFYFARRAFLKQRLEEGIWRRVWGGDDKTSRLYLLSMGEFHRLFNRNYLGL